MYIVKFVRDGISVLVDKDSPNFERTKKRYNATGYALVMDSKTKKEKCFNSLFDSVKTKKSTNKINIKTVEE